MNTHTIRVPHTGWHDAAATAFVAAGAVLFVVWTRNVAFTGWSTRAVGAIIFGLGYAACMSDRAEMTVLFGSGGRRRSLPYVVFASAVGALALVSGVVAIAAANAAALRLLVIAMVGLWTMATIRHVLLADRRSHVTEGRTR